MKVAAAIVVLSIVVALPFPASGAVSVGGTQAATTAIMTSATGQVMSTSSRGRSNRSGNQQNQANSGNTGGLADLTQLIILLTGPENWGAVRVLGPTGRGSETTQNPSSF